jgi:hypothetical protein
MTIEGRRQCSIADRSRIKSLRNNAEPRFSLRHYRGESHVPCASVFGTAPSIDSGLGTKSRNRAHTQVRIHTRDSLLSGMPPKVTP